MCSIKKGVLKNFAIFTEKHLCQSLFLCCNFIKNEALAQEFSCEFSKIFKIIFFTEHLWMTASIYKSCWLYTLQLFIAVNFQVVKSHLVGKKSSFMYLKDFTDLDFFFSIFFFLFILFDEYLFTLPVTQSVYCTLSSQPFCCLETPKHNDFDQFWKSKFHFEHFPRNTIS